MENRAREQLDYNMAQLQMRHDQAMEAQREEIERQRERFEFEIEILGERIQVLEKEKEELVQEHTRQKTNPMPKHPIMGKGSSEIPRGKSTTPAAAPIESSAKQRSYATVAASKPA